MNPTLEELRSIKSKVMACMETGNISQARTILTEFEAMYQDEALALSLDVVGAYGVVLL